MKKTGIITFHFVNNVGGVLQCVGLYRQILKTGDEAQVIDYRPKYHAAKYRSLSPVFYLARQNRKLLRRQGAGMEKRLKMSLKIIIGGTLGNLNYAAKKERAAHFDRFREQHLSQSRRYESIGELRKDPPACDTYICGSDQIWNTTLTNGVFDPAYFLRFGPKETRRIAYAVSAGETDLQAVAEQYREETRDLDAIFFRENKGLKKSAKVLGKAGQTAMDPTFFLTGEEWAEYETPVQAEKPFVFVYTVMKNGKVSRLVSELTTKHNINVIDGSVHEYMHGNGHYRYDPNCGPGEFLYYIRNADLVITNSFHGTAFSLIYHKNFVTIRNDKRNDRMEQILKLAGLEDRLVNDCDAETALSLEPPDYTEAERRLSAERERCAGLLRAAAEGTELKDLQPDTAEETEEEETIRARCGYLKDRDQLTRSSSGGAAYALSKATVKRGGTVFGVTYSEDFRTARYGTARTEAELEKFRSSKYVSAEKNLVYEGKEIPVFEAVAKELAAGREVLFTGLGCEAGALKQYLENRGADTEKLFLADLICYGATYPEIQKQYIDRLEKRYGAKITAFTARYKKTGWNPFRLRAEFGNGKTHEERFYDSDFGYAFRYFAKEACYRCAFKGDNHKADLTLGDYRGCSAGAEGYNPYGVSLMIPRTEKGEELIRRLEESGEFALFEADSETALEHNKAYDHSREKKASHEAFMANLKDRGLHYAVKKDQGFAARLSKIKHKAKDLVRR